MQAWRPFLQDGVESDGCEGSTARRLSGMKEVQKSSPAMGVQVGELPGNQAGLVLLLNWIPPHWLHFPYLLKMILHFMSFGV